MAERSREQIIEQYTKFVKSRRPASVIFDAVSAYPVAENVPPGADILVFSTKRFLEDNGIRHQFTSPSNVMYHLERMVCVSSRKETNDKPSGIIMFWRENRPDIDGICRKCPYFVKVDKAMKNPTTPFCTMIKEDVLERIDEFVQEYYSQQGSL